MKNIFVIFALSSALVFAQGNLGAPLVNGGSVTSVMVNINPNTVAVGLTAQASAQAFIGGSPNIDVTGSGIWTSLNPTIATITPPFVGTNSIFATVTGVASGTATIQFTLGSFTQTAQIVVGTAPLIAQTNMTGCPLACALPSGSTAGYTYNFTATGGIPGYTWSLLSGACLSGSGLSLSSAGVLTGSSPVAGTYSCTVQVTDTQPVTTSLAVSVTIITNAGGPPNYIAYSGNLIMPVGTTPSLSTNCTIGGQTNSCNNGSSANDQSYVTYGNLNSGNLSNFYRCTDRRSAPNFLLESFQAGLGGSSDPVLINFNNTIAHISDTNSHNYMTMLSSNQCTAPTGSGGVASGIFVTQAQNQVVAGGSNAIAVDFGAGNFDLTNPADYWSGPGGNDYDNFPTRVDEFVFTTTGTSGNFTYQNSGGVLTPTVDFIYGLPLGTNAPEWQANKSYGYGDYITHTLKTQSSTTPDYRKWVAATAYALGDLIVPGDSDGNATNPQACAFKAIIAGNSGASAPNFASENPCITNTVTESCSIGPCVKWKGINGPAKFVFQNVGKAGTSSGVVLQWYGNTVTPQNPTHPDLMSVVNDGSTGIIWQNMGPNYIPVKNSQVGSGWGGASSDQHRFAAGFSMNFYGVLNCGKADCYSTYEGGQGTGYYNINAETSDPVTSKPTYYLLNTLSGIQTNVTVTSGTLAAATAVTFASPANCTIGSSGSCSGSPFATGKPFQAITNLQDASQTNCNFFTHNAKASTDAHAIMIINQVNYQSPNSALCNKFNGVLWLPTGVANTGVYDPNANLQLPSDGLNHWFMMHTHICSWHNGGYGATSGVMMDCFPLTNISGNNGALPPFCGTGVGQPTCVTGTSGGAWSVPPYVFAISGQCSTTQITNSGGPNNGLPNQVYGALPIATYGGGGSPACNIANATDSHFGSAYNPSFNDQGNAFSVILYTATGSTYAQPYNAWQGEVVAVNLANLCTLGLSGTCQPPGGVGPVAPFGTMWRFNHTFNTNTNRVFSASVNGVTSQSSPNGTAVMWTSDMGCTLGWNAVQPGSMTGTGAPVSDGTSQLGHLPVTPSPASPLSFCGQAWQANFTYTQGTMVQAIKGVALGDVFQVIVGGTSGSSAPAWIGAGASLPPTAATAVSAASESGTTATITVASTTGLFNSGNLFVSGMTPSGYNCPSGCRIVGTAVNQVSYIANSSGLGPGTGFGTAYLIGSTFVNGTATFQDIGPQNGAVDVFITSPLQ